MAAARETLMTALSELTCQIIEHCPICGESPEMAIDLPAYPITELYEDSALAFETKGFFDQGLLYCEGCDHAFLRSVLDPGFVYSNYLTASTGSAGSESCLENLYDFVNGQIDLTEYTSVIDIGGNDSFFLNLVPIAEMRKVNVDPNGSGDDPVQVERSNLDAVDLTGLGKGRKILVSSHTLEHVENTNQMIAAISAAMSDRDVCFLQFPSLERLVQDFRFDQICHQHLNYFSARSISLLLAGHGLSARALEYDKDHFGTIRLMATRAGQGDTAPAGYSSSMDLIRQNWKTYRSYMAALNQSIAVRVENCSGFGAGLMVPTLAYSMPVIGQLRAIYDDNPDKQGKRFINLEAGIRSSSDMRDGESILLTSISTKISARRLVNKLVELGVEDIIVPNLSF
jgi:hypothetical protein